MKFTRLSLVIATINATSAMASESVTLESLELPDIELARSAAAARLNLLKFDRALDAINESCEECDELEDQVDELREDYQEKNGMPMFSFLGGPAYTPEQGLIVAAGGIYSFKTNREQEKLQRSVISGFLITNYGDGVGYGLRGTYKLFFDNDDFQFEGKSFIGNMPSNYWGVGFEAGDAIERGDETKHSAFVFDLDATFSKRISGHWFGDVIARINLFNPDSVPLTADENFLTYMDDNISAGFGTGVRYDSRDIAVNAWSGQYFMANLLAFNEAWGSSSNFYTINFDYRTYKQFSEGRVIALLSQYKQSFGDVPFYEMPTIGGGASMRGVYRGQYRDKTASEVTVEYRHTFRGSGGGLTNHGMTMWTGVGAVGDRPSDMAGNGIVSFGAGYRYQLQPRMNLRVDVGASKNGGSFYFNFTEAF
ncbi:BamA/TamA family outer membrane protein [Vibrio rotiferianus]|uniref:BamA/TamA family outer membrane protein n=1 Tax=Vibrio rotiferianus TaxID=190895 RepID=UPI00390A8086